MQKLERIPFFLITIPAFFFLYNNNYYYGLLDWSLFQSYMLIYALFPFLLIAVLKIFIPSWQKAGILTGLVLIPFYFFQPIHELIKSIPYLGFIGKYAILIPLLVIMILASVFYLRKTKKSVGKSFRFMNVLFAVLVCFEIGASLYNHLTGKRSSHDLADKQDKLSTSFRRCDTCLTPDIYFFIFDEYAGEDILRKEFGYSNAILIDFLRAKGFYVADNSRSNYNFTHMSLASEMNLGYLPSIDSGKNYFAKDFLQANYTVYNNEVIKILRKQGYKVENYSIFDLEGAPAHSIRPYRTEHLAIILNQTLPEKIKRDIGWNFTGKQEPVKQLTPEMKKVLELDTVRIHETREGVLKSLKSKRTSPVFTYTHFLIPHPPFYYDSTGKRLSPLDSYNKTGMNYYLQQLAYCNKFLIRPLIDSIFRLSVRPFVIILQGDHGYRDYPKGKEQFEMYNLNSFYFPDGDYNPLYPSISSVNTFRVLFNKYFHTRFPLLKDSSFYLTRSPG